MKKDIFKKFLALALNLIIVGSSFVGCGGGTTDGGNSSSSSDPGPAVELEDPDVYNFDVGVNKNKPFSLVKNGVPQYDILIREDLNKDLLAAINEMNGYITQLTGTALPVVKEGQGTVGSRYISIGATNAAINAGIKTADVAYDGFVMKTVGDDMYITGNFETLSGVNNTKYQRGCKFGVYDFIERFLGVRWLTYDYTYVPAAIENKSIDIYECDVVNNPTFEMRTWMGGDVTQFAAFGQHCRQFGGDSWSREWGSGHNTNYYIKKSDPDPDQAGKTYAESHPEWFVGHTNTHCSAGGKNELCFTSGVGEDGKLKDGPSVARTIINLIKGELETDAEKKAIEYYFLGHMDDRAAVCHCTTCDTRRSEIYDSGIWVMFLNCLSDNVNPWLMETQGREVKFLHFAYQYAERPPVEEVDGGYKPINDLVICRPTVGSRIAPISANYNYSFYDEKQTEADRLTMNGWQAVCDLFMIWDYACNFEEFWWYFPNTHILKENLQFYQEMGVVWAMNQSTWCQEGVWFDQMRSYISCKMQWNINWDVDFLINEFLTLYYDAAAEDVKEIYKLFDDNYAMYRLTTKGSMWINIFNSTTFLGTTYLPLSFLNRVLTKIDTTIANVDTMTMTTGITHGQLKTRLEAIRITPMTMILRNYNSYYSEATKLAYAKEYFDFCEQFNIKYLGESSGRTFEKRKASYGL